MYWLKQRPVTTLHFDAEVGIGIVTRPYRSSRDEGNPGLTFERPPYLLPSSALRGKRPMNKEERPMKRHLIRSTLFVTFATSLACLLSLSTSWAQSSFIAEQPDLDSTIQEVTQIQDRH